MMSCLSAVSPKQSVPGIDIFTSVLNLADRTLEKAFLDSGKLDLGLVSASSNGIEPQASLCADKVTRCALCLISFSLLSIPCQPAQLAGFRARVLLFWQRSREREWRRRERIGEESRNSLAGKAREVIGSLSSDVFEPRTLTGSLCSCFQHVFMLDQ